MYSHARSSALRSQSKEERASSYGYYPLASLWLIGTRLGYCGRLSEVHTSRDHRMAVLVARAAVKD